MQVFALIVIFFICAGACESNKLEGGPLAAIIIAGIAAVTGIVCFWM